jgi:hypothetical protein
MQERMMALMLGALYKALIEGHVSEEQARAAAEEVAGYENRLASIESRLTLLTWMVGTLVALTIGNLWLTFSILGRLPR